MKKIDIVGMAIWPFIFIWPPKYKTMTKLIKHEKMHLKQWTRYWLVGFIFLYIYQYVKYGYYYMPLEVEAREAAKK